MGAFAFLAGLSVAGVHRQKDKHPAGDEQDATHRSDWSEYTGLEEAQHVQAATEEQYAEEQEERRVAKLFAWVG
jgi:hypothetical protein